MSRVAEKVDTYGSEAERVDLDTEGRNVLLLEFSGQMALDEGCLQGDVVSEGSLLVSYEDICLSSASGGHRKPNVARRACTGVVTFPVPPSPTSTSLKVGMLPCAEASAMVVDLLWWRGDL